MFKKCLCSNKSVELSEYRLFMCSTISLIKMGDKTAVIYARVFHIHKGTLSKSSSERVFPVGFFELSFWARRKPPFCNSVEDFVSIFVFWGAKRAKVKQKLWINQRNSNYFAVVSNFLGSLHKLFPCVTINFVSLSLQSYEKTLNYQHSTLNFPFLHRIKGIH